MADYDSETGHDTDTDSNHVSRGVTSFVLQGILCDKEKQREAQI